MAKRARYALATLRNLRENNQLNDSESIPLKSINSIDHGSFANISSFSNLTDNVPNFDLQDFFLLSDDIYSSPKMYTAQDQQEIILESLKDTIKANRMDQKIKWTGLYRCVVALFGLLLAIIELEVSFRSTHNTDIDPIGYKPAEIIKICNSITTFFLLILIIIYHRIQLWSHKQWISILLGSQASEQSIFRRTGGMIADATETVKSVRLNFVIEMLIGIIHCPPYFDVITDGKFTDKLQLFMFLRLIYLLRVIRDFSAIFENRRAIVRSIGGSIVSSQFNTLLTMKQLFNEYPVAFLFSWLSASILVIAYCVHVLERDTNPPFEPFWPSIYLVVQCMATGWPTDSYEYYNPITYGGRMLCLSACVIGLFLFSLMIDFAFTAHLLPNKLDEYAVNWVMRTKLKRNEREAAARLIQVVYRFYRWKTIIAPNIPRDQRRRKAASFFEKYIQSVASFQLVKRFKSNNRNETNDNNIIQKTNETETVTKYVLDEITNLKEEFNKLNNNNNDNNNDNNNKNDNKNDSNTINTTTTTNEVQNEKTIKLSISINEQNKNIITNSIPISKSNQQSYSPTLNQRRQQWIRYNQEIQKQNGQLLLNIQNLLDQHKRQISELVSKFENQNISQNNNNNNINFEQSDTNTNTN
eukprot:TRINITY_DN1473_c0_g1_i1.p1 TRINITY_DN1473_c0_g1~~TRINITY_DN1473_c0_g1_i1.p1  ORF type:complete len:654 (-),score=228.03 TRINITY_DN1473_c0_g1_i1:14-1936(-)